MCLAAAGFLLSVVAHVLALAGVSMPGGNLVWGLHVGIFIVWIPTVLVSIQITRFSNRKDYWKIVLAGCPGWMRSAVYVLFGYAILNFVFFMGSVGSQSKHLGAAPPAAVVRGFSGHWMVFYAVAFAVLYSRIRAPQLYQVRRCPNGHVAGPSGIRTDMKSRYGLND